MPDKGPIYLETVHYHQSGATGWPVEPWNTLSSLLFIVIVGYWVIKLWGQFRHFRFMGYALVVLCIGGLGGFLYHSFRSDVIYLFMDWFPIVILTISVAFWFTGRLIGHWGWALLLSLISYVVFFGGFAGIHEWLGLPRRSISLGYVIAGLYIATPLLLYLKKTAFCHGRWVLGAIGFFLPAVFFRSVDMEGWLPMGTHFLWHVLGAVATHCLLYYTFLTQSDVRRSL
ncbi:MAG: hypothetical protein CMF31_00245 [Kordiimonas sp.]|nr:hypothetical protein [Kordiimonas sp.]